MSTSLKTSMVKSIKILAAFTPWVISMFTLYWLEYGGIWTTETPHRGKASVVILVTGMVLSFLIQSRFNKKQNPQQSPG